MQTIQRGMAPEREATILQVFLQACNYPLNPDGRFGSGTEQELRKFQQANGLIVDGVAGEKTWTTLFALQPGLLAKISAKWLSQQDIVDFAAQRQLEVPTVRAVYSVESGGSGFMGLKPKILFEGHVFWKQLQAAGINPKLHVRGNEDILYPTWDSSHYQGGLAEYDRLERAQQIDPTCALRSASWGMFQIMGFHAESLGYADVNAFVSAMGNSEADQLGAFGNFIAQKKVGKKTLMDCLRARDWTNFALGYNGAGYAQHGYHLKLAQAYAKYKALP